MRGTTWGKHVDRQRAEQNLEGANGPSPSMPCDHPNHSTERLVRPTRDKVQGNERSRVVCWPDDALSACSLAMRPLQPDSHGTGIVIKPNRLIFMVGFARHQR